MITTADAPPWLRRSDQAVTWARTMLTPGRAVVIDCETTDLPGVLCEIAVVDTSGKILLSTLVNPCRPIVPDATRVHNITDKMVAGANRFPGVLSEGDGEAIRSGDHLVGDLVHPRGVRSDRSTGINKGG